MNIDLVGSIFWWKFDIHVFIPVLISALVFIDIDYFPVFNNLFTCIHE
jgi:hypothetical protein